MTRWKKFVSMLLAAIFMLSTGVQAFAGTSLENALNKVNLYTKGSQEQPSSLQHTTARYAPQNGSRVRQP